MNGFFLVRNYFSFTLFKASETEKRNKTESYKTPINFSLYIVACLLLFCDIKLLLKRTCWKILWKNYVIRLFVCRGNENIQAILACELWNVITLFSFAAKLWVRRGEGDDVIALPDTNIFLMRRCDLGLTNLENRKILTHFRWLHTTGQIPMRQRLLMDERER